MAIGQHLSNKNPDGSSFGQSSTDLIAFYGSTPIVQRSGATQAAIANAAAGTFGFNSAAEKTAWHTLVTEMRVVLVNLGLMAGA